ncbi:hypothetical protein BBJ28_00002051 [Nothophytophthora sp. Chile5]|nr:hypothetical protein BBJ28_00002051 [Nothophytophthora sp. Chile5]
MSIQAPVSRADAGAPPSRSFCVLLLGFVLCLRPLRRVFTCPELLLVVLLAFVHDRWRASLMRGKVAGSDYTRPSLAPKKARRKTCTVVSISQEGKMALVRGGNDLAVDSPSTGPQGSCCWEPCRAIKTLEGQMDSAADSAGSGTTSNASDLTFLSTAAVPRGYEDDGQSDETEGATARMLPRRGGSLLISNSICMSRGVGEQVQNLVFSNASGDLQLRRDALDCSLHLSVLTGQLLVHRKSKTEPEIFPLVLFTGSSLHRRRPNAFKMTEPKSSSGLQKDVEALDRVLFRLASVDDERLVLVLQSLLPQLLRLFPRSLAAPMELQLKDKAPFPPRLWRTCTLRPKMPLVALSQILQVADLSVFAYNLAFLFIGAGATSSQIGFDAAEEDEQARVLAVIAGSLATFSSAQQEIFFRLLVRVLPISAAAVFPRAKTVAAEGEAEGVEEREETTSNGSAETDANDANMDVLLDLMLDLVLYEGPSSASTQAAAPNAALYGLLAPRVERLQRVKVSDLKREALYDRQLQSLKFVKELDIPTKRKIPLYLAGSASFHHAIKAFSDEQLSRVIKYEEEQLEDAEAVRRLMALVLGSQVAQSSGAFEGSDALLLSNRTRLADTSILQTLTLLSTSKAATNVLPMILQLLCQLMFGAEPSRPPNVANKIKLASIRLCQWTFHHCEVSSLQGLLGPVLFPTLLRLLMNPHTESEESSAEFVREFRQGVYEALSLLAARVPALVASSEQAFQVLLVRCLAEEEHRTGAGANALKAFTAFASAYGAAAPPQVRAKVHSELVALLNGSKLFDSSKNYVRVRTAIAAWCAELLTNPSSSPQDSDITMRFALLRLGADHDEETRRLSTKALLAKPLPSMKALAASLQANFPHKDLKKSMRDNGAAESCVRFCLEIMKAAHQRGDKDDEEDRQRVVEYVVQTFLGRQEQAEGSRSTTASALVYETAAKALVEVCGFDAKSVGTVLSGQTKELVEVASVSQERAFLMNISTIVTCACAAAFSTSQVVSEVVQAAVDKLDSTSASEKELCGALYVLGSALAHFDSAIDCARTLTAEEMQLLLSCFQKMTTLLTSKLKEGSNFTGYPRSEEAQKARVALLRSVMDGVGLAGTLKNFMRNAAAEVGSEWSRLKALTLVELERVIKWKLAAVRSDDQLSPKLTALKRVAIENLGRATSSLPGAALTAEVSNALETALDALLELEGESDAELQFTTGEVLVALGTHDAEEQFALDSSSKYESFSENRAAAIFQRVLADYAGSRQPKVRRNATIWLLCMCAAGLASPSEPSGEGATSPSPLSWKSVLVSPAYSQLVLETHEFFVTMLNDPNDVPKESAVKGLAYLRLRAPTDAMGEQFSDSLFRRLRCFRAFAPTADAAVDDDDVGANTDNNRASEATAPSAPSSSSQSSSTVENAAYREVSNVAADVGDPELMYALLYLSTADPIWDSFATASSAVAQMPQKAARAFSFIATDKLFRASIVAKAGSLWMAEEYANKTKLVPWLFLLKFHSNSKVAAVMGNLWEFAKGSGALAATAQAEKTLLRQNWALLFQFALARLENARNFKYREAACLALIDLLNGAEADALREDFLRLWKTASRAVDDVMEAVGLAGVKLYRYLGELSLRVAAGDATCRSQLLEFLTADGITSKNVLCRTLSIDLLLRLVKALKAEDMQDRLAPLLLKLLEYLSSLEMPELQYAQFHVEKKDQLERLRVSISQSGPVGQLLELTTTRLKELAGSPGCVAVVTQLVRGVGNLLKFGVGLNTRVGTANFVVTLAGELPFELRKSNGAEFLLRRVLIPYVGAKTAAENDQYGDEESRYGGGSSEAASGDATATTGLADGLVVQSYCRAAAYLCPLVEAPTVKEYVRAGIFAFNAFSTARPPPSSAEAGAEAAESSRALPVYTSRFLLISALATKELVKRVPPIADADSVVANDLRNAWYCAHVLPAAFVGQFAAAEALTGAWTAVLAELPPTVLYASSSLDAVLQAAAQLLAHPAWDTRRQAARALQAVFASASYRARLSPAQVARAWKQLLAAVPGRLWTGKGALLEALVALAAIAPDQAADRLQPLSALLLAESARAWRNQDAAYMESAVASLGRLAARLPRELRAANVRALRSALAVWLAGDAADGADSSDSSSRPPLPPLLIKGVLEALALMWPPAAAAASSAGDSAQATEAALWLCAGVATPPLGAWSVRRAAFQTLAAVVARAPVSALSAAGHVLERVLERCCGGFGVGDAQYAAVRVAAADALAQLLQRAQDDADVAQRLLVQRERVEAAAQTLRRHEEPAEQQAACRVRAALELL